MCAIVPGADSAAMVTTAPSVVLVDDSTPLREMLKELICASTPARIVGEAGTAEAAIAQIKSEQPDFVVLDYQLPDGSGLDVLRDVRNKSPRSCFIVLTNHASVALRRAFEDAGAQYFLDKSHDFGQLAPLIAAVSSSER